MDISTISEELLAAQREHFPDCTIVTAEQARATWTPEDVEKLNFYLDRWKTKNVVIYELNGSGKERGIRYGTDGGDYYSGFSWVNDR